MNPARRVTALFALTAGVAFGAVAIALVSQHAYGMDPCAWCVLQRLLFCAVGVAALVGLAWRRVLGARVTAVAAMVLADLGIAAALWQHTVASKSASCNLTLADRVMDASRLPSLLPDVFEARASCADAAVALFGVSYDLWSTAAFLACSLLATWALLLTPGRRASR